ncbi:hypothetical protein KI387_018072, partial [Taxus chinensis]
MGTNKVYNIPLVALACGGVVLVIAVTTCWKSIGSMRRNGVSTTENGDVSGFPTEDSSNDDSVGLDRQVIQALPILVYNSQEYRFKEGEKCAVCLSDFMDNDKVRILPSCNHCFHSGCIDRWFSLHSQCPVCRTMVQSNASSSLLNLKNNVGRNNSVSEDVICSNEVEDQNASSDVDQGTS